MKREVEYKIGDYVFPNMTPRSNILRFRVRDKLASRFSRPFKIMERIGVVAYRLDPPSL